MIAWIKRLFGTPAPAGPRECTAAGATFAVERRPAAVHRRGRFFTCYASPGWAVCAGDPAGEWGVVDWRALSASAIRRCDELANEDAT